MAERPFGRARIRTPPVVAEDPFVLQGVVVGHRILEWDGETPLPRSLADD